MKPPEGLTKGKDIFPGLLRTLSSGWISRPKYTRLLPSRTTFQLMWKETVH